MTQTSSPSKTRRESRETGRLGVRSMPLDRPRPVSRLSRLVLLAGFLGWLAAASFDGRVGFWGARRRP